MYGTVQVSGVNNLRAAVDVAYERLDDLPLPTDGEYVEASFEINAEDDDDFLIAQGYAKYDAHFEA